MNKQKLAEKWIAAWNAHDLPSIMALYSSNIQHTSPSIAKYYQLEGNTIKDKALLQSYFQMALEKNPSLHFDLQHILEGNQSVVLVYGRMQTKLAGEYLEFDETGLIVRSCSHYKAVVGEKC